MIQSTWREVRFSLVAGEVFNYNFIGTTPNFFVISNNGASPVYVGPTSSVSITTFDLIIPAYGIRIYAKPMGFNTIHFYCSTDVNIYLASEERDFDPAMISQTQEISAPPGSGLLGIVDIRAILNSLPEGQNLIGKVDIFSLPALPTGGNTIGNVRISGAIPAGANAIGTVGVTTLPEVYLAGWTWAKVEATGTEDITVKATAGKVAKLVSDDAEVIYLKDGTNQAWKTGDYDGIVPISCITSIVVNFAGAGTAWILYK